MSGGVIALTSALMYVMHVAQLNLLVARCNTLNICLTSSQYERFKTIRRMPEQKKETERTRRRPQLAAPLG
ncbi:hypothetical protein V8C37DRAFT_363820 [Trichoderma ceciliae]